MSKLIVSFVESLLAAGLVTLGNCFVLGPLARPAPAETFELFIYSITQSGPLIFATMFTTLYYWSDFFQPERLFGKYGFVIGACGLVLAVTLNVLLLPRNRFP